MGKFDGVLLVSDYDDTFLGTDHKVPARNLEALRYFQSKGGKFTIATGRALSTFSPHVHLTPINAPAVLSNGSALYDFQRGKMLMQTVLPDSAVDDMEKLLKQFPELGAEFYNGEDIYVHNPNYITDAHMKKVGSAYTVRPVREIPTPWTKIILQQEENYQPEVQKWFLARYGHAYEAIFSNRWYLEVTAKGSTKGGMVQELARRLDIRAENIYCVGDNQNDIPMLACANRGFAPANCAREVKDWGAHIMCHCNDGVIGDIVEYLDQKY